MGQISNEKPVFFAVITLKLLYALTNIDKITDQNKTLEYLIALECHSDLF